MSGNQAPGGSSIPIMGAIVGLAIAGPMVAVTSCSSSSGAAAPSGSSAQSTGPTSPASSSSSSAQTSSATGGPPAVSPDANTPGDIPDTQAFVPYRWPGGGFTVSVPEGWGRGADGAATLFTQKYNAVRIEEFPAPVAPTTASATATELPRLRATVAGFHGGDVSMQQRTAGRVVLIRYGANSRQDPVTGKSVISSVERYEFWRGNVEVALTLSSPQGADNVDAWRTVTNSLRWV